MSSGNSQSETYFFEWAAYMVASARGLLDEPQIYGPIRLLEALRKLLEVLRTVSILEQDLFLTQIEQKLERREYLPSSKLKTQPGLEWFEKYLDQIAEEFAREAKRRMKFEK